jgi:hypothetical protein
MHPSSSCARAQARIADLRKLAERRTAVRAVRAIGRRRSPSPRDWLHRRPRAAAGTAEAARAL